MGAVVSGACLRDQTTARAEAREDPVLVLVCQVSEAARCRRRTYLLYMYTMPEKTSKTRELGNRLNN